MPVGFNREPLLDALRSHVALEPDVSDALTALHTSHGAGLTALLNETRELAARLTPGNDHGRPARLDLESWLGGILRGPHDRKWFDERIRAGRGGWLEVPASASAVLIAGLRHRLTEMARTMECNAGEGGHRMASALARLFDLEIALVLLGIDVGQATDTSTGEANSVALVLEDATLAVGNALCVIETSAYLVGQYSQQSSPPRAQIDRHLDRISKHVDRTRVQMRRMNDACDPGRKAAN